MEITVHVEIFADDFDAAVDRAVSASLDAIVPPVVAAWRAEAAAGLNETRGAYQRGASVAREGDEIVATLRGGLAVAVEAGSNPFDLKPGFLRNTSGPRNIPVGGGRFRTVSPQSPASSWLHPGIRPRRILRRTLEKLNLLSRDAFAGQLEKIDG